MSKLGLVIVLILMAGRTYAQDYFVLIEADKGQPFYARIDSQFYRSSAGGHLILSRLRDSTYIITIGFPGQVLPERQFTFNVNKNDHDLRLKNEDGKGWWLTDEKGQELAMVNGNNGGASARIPGVKKDDAFSRLMADIVKDTAVMYSSYATEQATPLAVATVPVAVTPAHSVAAKDSQTLTIIRPSAIHPVDSTFAADGSRDTSLAVHPAVTPPPGSGMARAAAVPAVDSGATNTALYQSVSPKDTILGTSSVASGSSAPPPAPLSSVATALYRTTSVTMLTEHRSSRSLRQVYTDHDSSGKADTIVIIIPLDTPTQTGRPAIASVVPRTVHTTDGGHPTEARSHGPNPDSPALGSARPSAKTTLVLVNSDCHNFATDYDVDKLRVKMLESAKDEDRILAARKVFKIKCFSTRQIRALSEVFTTDAAKFKFLEAAYPFVSDDHFAELSNLLADPVYSDRFRAMTDHP